MSRELPVASKETGAEHSVGFLHAVETPRLGIVSVTMAPGSRSTLNRIESNMVVVVFATSLPNDTFGCDLKRPGWPNSSKTVAGTGAFAAVVAMVGPVLLSNATKSAGTRSF